MGRRKTFDIEYVIVDEDNIEEIAAWCGGTIGGEGKDRFIRIFDKNALNTRQTKAFFGDYVVHSKDTKTFKSFGRKAFNKTFVPLEATVTKELDRSAETGKFVSHETAAANPETTVHETVVLPRDADPS